MVGKLARSLSMDFLLSLQPTDPHLPLIPQASSSASPACNEHICNYLQRWTGQAEAGKASNQDKHLLF